MPAIVALVASICVCLIAAPVALAEEESLPPVHLSYSGVWTQTQHATEHAPDTGRTTLSWSAEGDSLGKDGALSLHFTSLSGTSISERPGGCPEYTYTFSPPSQEQSWGLDENLEYPLPGWKYQIYVDPRHVAVNALVRADPCNGNPVTEYAEETLVEPLFLYKESRKAEVEAMSAPLEVEPGKSASVTREYSFKGIITGEECACLPDDTEFEQNLKLTIAVNSPAPGNVVESPPPPPKTKTEPPPTTPPSKEVSEKRRQEIKEQARADLKPALQADWAAHGLSAGFGLAAAGALSAAADELGQKGAVFEGNDANVRVINDYRIVKDPPGRDYQALAQPAAVKPDALPSCRRFHGGEAKYCKSLRAAEDALLAQSGQAAATDEALYTTISRDTAAIDAGSYAAAEEQASHFEALHAQLEATLGAQAKAGAQVAALLRKAHVKGVATRAQSAKAIKSAEEELSRNSITSADIDSLAGSALTPQKTNLLDVLGQS